MDLVQYRVAAHRVAHRVAHRAAHRAAHRVAHRAAHRVAHRAIVRCFELLVWLISYLWLKAVAAVAFVVDLDLRSSG